jgi:hypothetical protein
MVGHPPARLLGPAPLPAEAEGSSAGDACGAP